MRHDVRCNTFIGSSAGCTSHTLIGSLWRCQSQQSFNTLTPFYFPFSLTTCFGPHGPSSGEIYN
jgi:hypothetical protein